MHFNALSLIVILSLSASSLHTFSGPSRLAMKAIVSDASVRPTGHRTALLDSVAMSSKRGRAAADGTAQEFRRHKSGVNDRSTRP